MRIVLTGGGTGGHAYPAISIAEALRSEFPECELLYIGSKNSLEARLAAEAGLEFFGVTSRKLTKLVSPGAVLTAASLTGGFAEALAKLKSFKPDVVIGTGGYASAAVVMAQALRRGKTIILEQDVIPGRTNRWLSRFASRICVAFEDAAWRFPGRKVIMTGSPIRAGLLHLPEREVARSVLGLDGGKFTVLVLGGSQGARRLNEVTADAASRLSELPVQVLHQVGQRNYGEAEERRAASGWKHYHVRAYIDDMRNAYAAADLVMCRCGSSTIAEITAIGLPAILVPYPYAHADHQRLNAEFVACNGGGIVVNDGDLSADFFAGTVERLAASPEEVQRMSEASRELGKPNAAVVIARLAVEMITGKGVETP